MDESPSVTRFRAYLRCDTSHPHPDFTGTVALLRTWADELGLRFAVHAETDAMPVVVMTWAGEVPEAVVLNSHMDVVPATRGSGGWTVDPFGAERRDGRIYARGAQDMKCVAVQYVEAVRRLKAAAFRPHHTLHLTFMPDEEIGGHRGMARLVGSPLWHALLPALVLDEGLPYPGPEGYHLFHAERAPWWINVKIHGTTGHASRFLENTAGPKLTRILSRFNAFRDEQHRLLKEGKKEDGTPYTLGDVTTVNLTMLQGGVEHNVLPDPLLVGFDLRIPPTVSLDEFKSQMEGWCLCEEGVTVEYLQFTSTHSSTPLDTKWSRALADTAQSMCLTLFPSTMPASTDARFVRPHVPAYGISPLRNTPQLLHAVDEYLDETVFLEGIDFYERAIRALDKVR